MFRRRVSFLFVALCVTLFSAVASAEPPKDYPTFDKAPSAEKTGASDVAVIVAVEDYVFLPDVKGATANGNDWERFFQDSLGVGTVHFLSNAQGTKEELERFALLASQSAKPGGTVWFVFIGHGAPAKNGSEGLLVGADARQDPNSLFARGVPQQALLDILQTGQQAQTVLVVDACFSGRAGDGSALAPAQPVIPTTLNPTLQGNSVVLTAAKSDEFAGSLPGLDRPAFSYLLLGALRGWAANGDKAVTAKEAQSFVQRSLRGIPGRMTQTPSLHGQADVVLTRGVGEIDPGISALMRKKARKPGRSIVNPTHTVIEPVASSASGIPMLPDKLNPKGAINLSVEAEILVARDHALSKEANGVNDPEGAAAAWRAVAKMKGENPFREEANTRADQWDEYGRKQKALAYQKRSDYERLQKILPLASVSEVNKAELIKNYTTLYGQSQVIDLVSMVTPSAARHKLCEPYMDLGSSEVRVTMPNDRDGEPFKGEVEVAGKVVGVAPTSFTLPKCARDLGIKVTERESGKVWEGTISRLTPGDTTVIDTSYEDLIPYSIWHDYIWDESPSGPLLGVMYSTMGFPTGYVRENAQAVRGNVELGIGSFASHFSLWFEPSVTLPQGDQDAQWAFAGGAGVGRLSAGRFSLSPIRVGYQKYTGEGDLGDLQGFTGHGALRFHLGKGIQLRGDGGVLMGQGKDANGGDWDGLVWHAGGGLEYGNNVIHELTGEIIDDADFDGGGDEWEEWTEASFNFGYRVGQGYVADQDALMGSFVLIVRGADSYDEGGMMELSGATNSLGGLDSDNFLARWMWAFMNDDEDVVFGYGLSGGYTGFENLDSWLFGMDLLFGYHFGAHISFNVQASLNALAFLNSDDEDLTAEPGTEDAETPTKNVHPAMAYLRWVMPFGLYVQGGASAHFGADKEWGGWGEAGYAMPLD